MRRSRRPSSPSPAPRGRSPRLPRGARASSRSSRPSAWPPPVAGDRRATPTTAMLARFASSMGPMFVGLQVGSTAGHLAEHALGSSAFPLPWPGPPHALVVVRNVAQFAEDWSLDQDAVTAFTSRASCRRVVFAHGPVADRVEALLAEATAAQLSAQRTLLERLTEADVPRGALVRCSATRSVPGGALGARGGRGRTRARRAERRDHGAQRLLRRGGPRGRRTRGRATPRQLAEAWHRHRTGDSKGVEAAAALFGVDLSRERVDLGRGVRRRRRRARGRRGAHPAVRRRRRPSPRPQRSSLRGCGWRGPRCPTRAARTRRGTLGSPPRARPRRSPGPTRARGAPARRRGRRARGSGGTGGRGAAGGRAGRSRGPRTPGWSPRRPSRSGSPSAARPAPGRRSGHGRPARRARRSPRGPGSRHPPRRRGAPAIPAGTPRRASRKNGCPRERLHV